ncbi:MAG: class I SAM-dependent methyltransferase [Bacteroidota bacterium]
MNESNKMHWDTIYETKTPHEVSWTQEIPHTSLEFIRSLPVDKKAKIIDIGGGESKLVDFLLAEGYENITVLDISAKALEKTKNRLGEKAGKVKWIVTDITEFIPSETYDIWHDRAVFHFLISSDKIEKYKTIIKKSIKGYFIIGTFSEKGPTKCSGLDIKQYNENDLGSLFNDGFRKINCVVEDHKTPFDTIQNFTFCSFERDNKSQGQ